MTERKWNGKTQGGSSALRMLFFLLKHVHIRFFYAILRIVAVFYMIFGRKGYKAQYFYFRKIWKLSPLTTFFKIYKNHFLFAQVVIDKFAVLSGSKPDFKFEVEGKLEFDKLIQEKNGAIIISSHIGNFEIAGCFFDLGENYLNSLVFAGENPTFQEFRKKMWADNHINPIFVYQDFSHIFELNKVLQNKELLGLPGDRFVTGKKLVVREFLGRKAKFPAGAFHLAVKFNMPVVLFFVMKDNLMKYHVFVKKIEVNDDNLSEIQIVEKYVEKYVNEMEKILKKYPEQWFNYFDFWDN